MPERTVSVGLVADVSNYLAGMQKASSSTTALGKNAQTTGDLTRGFVSKVGGSISSLGNQIGGTFGQLLSTVGNDIDKVSSKSAKLSTALEVGGGAAVAAGIGLEQLGSGAIQATEQLNSTIVASGDSVSDYSKQIDEAVARNQNFGHSAEDTKNALATLIPAAGSTSAALKQMDVVSNLAAAKHESLAAAATAVARILGGTGTRTLSVYGIQMDGVGTKAQQGTRALDALDKKLSGQSSAAVSNFSGQVGVATTHIADFVKEAAGPAGQVLIGLGVTSSATGVVIDVLRLRTERAAAAQLAMNAAAAESVAPLEAESVAAAEASASTKGLGGALAGLAGPAGLVALGAGVAFGVSALGTLTNAAVNNTISFKNAAGASKAFQKQVALSNGIGPLAFGGTRVGALAATTGVGGAVGSFENGIGLAGSFDPQFVGANATVTKIDASLSKLVKSGNAAAAAAEFNKWKEAAKEAGISTADLDSKFPAYIKAVKDTGTTIDKTAGSTMVFANATKDQAKALTDATNSAIKSVAPLTDFGSVVTDVQKKLQENATATAAATKSTKDSASDFYDGSSVSLQQFTDQLTANDAAGQTWLDNIQKLAQTQPEIAAQFEAAGYTATNSSLLQQLINATPAQSAAYIKAQKDAIALAGKAAADALLADPYLEEAGHAISDKTATALGASIAAGVPVATALQELGIKVSATPLNIPVKLDTDPAAAQLDKFHQLASNGIVIPIHVSGSLHGGSANGNLFVGQRPQAFANGGEGIYSGGAPIYKFAEPETGWEAFISGRPGQNARNRRIWQTAGEKLGVHSSASVVHGDTNVNINEVSDPVGTANAVLRRLNLAKA